ncbi:MAG: ribosome maturation factor RimP [Desulfovibrionaceae bacterium]|nr:ribosome maturation factor RimP [Desulfovibrionaceae bacterium]
MSNNSLRATLLQLAAPAVRAQGLDIWGLEIVDGRQMIVRLYVEAPADAGTGADAEAAGGEEAGLQPVSPAQLSATVDQCETISRQFSLALDAEDVIDRAYTLEVSTPGFNRIFFSTRQMNEYVGDMVEARLPSPWSPGEGLPARRTWKGRLAAVGEDSFTLVPSTIDTDGLVTEEALPPAVIPFERARRVNRIHVFVRPAKPGKKPKK